MPRHPLRAEGQGRRARGGTDPAELWHRLRFPRPLRQQHPDRPAFRPGGAVMTTVDALAPARVQPAESSRVTSALADRGHRRRAAVCHRLADPGPEPGRVRPDPARLERAGQRRPGLDPDRELPDHGRRCWSGSSRAAAGLDNRAGRIWAPRLLGVYGLGMVRGRIADRGPEPRVSGGHTARLSRGELARRRAHGRGHDRVPGRVRLQPRCWPPVRRTGPARLGRDIAASSGSGS